MLNKIEIKDVFAHKHTIINLEEGLTRIAGANEAGKSQVFEMIRWALFGNKALRTSPEDYSGGSVTLTFNDTYKVHRTTGNATLHNGDQLVARSTTAVNKKIIEIVGYGLKTFDNVNSINQNEVEKLTSMGLPERKKFLDELIGAAQIDQLVLDYKTQLQIVKAEVDALENSVIQVKEPRAVKARKLDFINVDIAELEVRTAAYYVQEKQVENLQREVSKVFSFPDPYPNRSIEELNIAITGAERSERLRSEQAEKWPEIKRLFDQGVERIDVDKLAKDVQIVLEAKGTPKPQFTIEEVKTYAEKHKAHQAFLKVEELKRDLEVYKSCPNLEKEVEATVAEINKYINDAKPYHGLPSTEALEEAVRANQKYDAVALRLRDVLPEAYKFSEPVRFTKMDWEEAVKAFQIPKIKIGGLYESIRSKEERARLAEKQSELDVEKSKLQAIDIEKLNRHIETLKAERQERERYEMELRYYDEVTKKNESIIEKAAEKKKELVESQAVVKALQGFKYYINTYFLPSVGKAASAMLVTMTNGKRKRINITDKFEITVDGLSVEALSGSTKAIVNIALRFALQFVLTKNSFSVFMADEVDGSFDPDRAKYLNESMTGMTDHIAQVIVISHKDITTQHVVKL